MIVIHMGLIIFIGNQSVKNDNSLFLELFKNFFFRTVKLLFLNGRLVVLTNFERAEFEHELATMNL